MSQPLIDYGRMLDLLAVEGQLLTAATHDADPEAVVSGVSMSTLRETVRCAGSMCAETLAWLGASDAWQHQPGVLEGASLREVTSGFTARLADLLAEFGTRPADDRCRTWWPAQRNVGFWLRRTVHATTVFRVDVQTAANVERTSIDAALASDGIDELLALWLGFQLGSLGFSATRPCTVGIRTAEHAWHVALMSGGARTARQEAVDRWSQDAVISGDPSLIYLWLWGRLPDRSVEILGDRDSAAQLWSLLQVATRAPRSRLP